MSKRLPFALSVSNHKNSPSSGEAATSQRDFPIFDYDTLTSTIISLIEL
jgi:hypothetical protein